VHGPLADWVKQGGVLVFCDKDADPYLKVRDWWNGDGNHYLTPRQDLFEKLGVNDAIAASEFHRIGHGGLIWLRERPAQFSFSAAGAEQVVNAAKLAAKEINLPWRQTSYLLLRRGPYVIASGLDDAEGCPRVLYGRFVNLFDPRLRVLSKISLVSGSRMFLIDLKIARTGQTHVLAASCQALVRKQTKTQIAWDIEGVDATPGIILMESEKKPGSVTLDGDNVPDFEYSGRNKLLWIRFDNKAEPRRLIVNY
jgi:hypothetical protein